MSETMNFKVFCLENYKQAHKLTGAQTLDLFKKYAILDYIGAVYDSLHSTGSNYIVEDIDLFIKARQNV